MDKGPDPHQQGLLDAAGNVLVLAGPGAGKTTTLVLKAAQLTEQLLAYQQVLVLTFNRKAALHFSLKLRAHRVANVTVKNYHAFGYQVLSLYRKHLCFDSEIGILSPKEQAALLQEAANLAKLREVDLLKAACRERYVRFDDPPQVDQAVMQALAAYDELKRRHNRIDYDDLITLPIMLFRSQTWLLEAYRDKYPYVLVDEFQDTDAAQFALLELLASDAKQVIAVADEDQVIYEFRGARRENLRRFLPVFRASIRPLRYNHRATKRLIAFANLAILPNRRDPERASEMAMLPPAEAPEGVSPTVRFFTDDLREEAAYIFELLRNNVHGNHGTTIVLIRSANPVTRSLLREIQNRLKAEGLEFFDIAEDRILRHTLVMLFLSLLRLSLNPSDHVSLADALALCRGFGDTSIARIVNHCRSHKTTLDRVPDSLLNASQRVRWTQLREAVSWCHRYEAPPREVFRIATQLYPSLTGQDLTPSDHQVRIDVEGLLAEYADLDSRELVSFAEAVLDGESLLAREDQSRILFGNVHQVKGLEFPNVIVAGSVAPIFPDYRSAVEAERRLFYVATTRAKRELFITGTEGWFWFGNRRRRCCRTPLLPG